MSQRAQWTSRFALTAVMAGLAVVGYLLLWTTFMVYDDEGYVLYSLRTFSEHGHLYDRVYTQYGPFFFQFLRVLHTFGLEFTNAGARGLTLVCWLSTAGFCAALVWRETRGSFAATVATLVGVFAHLWRMVAEPSHPGGLIAAFVALAAWSGTNRKWPASFRAIAIGAIGAALVLAKINVGAFLFVSAFGWWALNCPTNGSKLGLRLAIVGLFAALPFILMRPLLSETWVLIFALAIATGSVAILATATGTLYADSTRRNLSLAIVAAALVTVLTLALTVLNGTTLRGLLEGVILGPLRHPTLYTVAFSWRTGTLVLAIVAIPAAAIATRLPHYRRAPFILILRSVLVIAYVLCIAELGPVDGSAFVLGYGLTTAWVFTISTGGDDPSYANRVWLGLLFMLQALHAYPVAGSQIAWGTFLWVPLAALAIHALGTQLKTVTMRRAVALGALAVTTVIFVNHALLGWQRYRGSDELRLRGAEHLRLPESFTSGLRMLAHNSGVHGNLLFSLPGMQSFNLWTNLPPPTTANATHWFNLLSAQQQAEIQQRLESAPRAVLIVQRDIYDLLVRQGVVAQTPLLRWLLANYAPVFNVATYEFWVRKDRSVIPVSAARLYRGAPGAPTRHKVDVVIAEPNSPEIATVELRRFLGDGSATVATWDNQNARFVVTPIASDGRAQAAPAEKRLPFVATGILQLDIYTNVIPDNLSPADAIIYLRDATGQKIAEARLIE
jgi:hypothetical protein